MSKSMYRRLAVQIPLEQQPEFLAGTFDAEVLKKALKILEPDPVDLESIEKLEKEMAEVIRVLKLNAKR